MQSFRQNVISQIQRIEKGRIFTFQDLSYPVDKLANEGVILSQQS